MKILQLVPRVPYPLTDGGAQGIFHITKELAALGHDVHMVALSRSGIDETSELEKFCTVTVIRARTQTTKLGAFRALLSREPFTTRKYWHPRAAAQILELARIGGYDLVHVDHLHMVRYGQMLRRELGVPVILREHNFETTIVQRYYEIERNPLLKAYAFIEYRKLVRYEAEACGSVDLNVMITEEDETRLKRANPSVATVLMPAGVADEYFQNFLDEPSNEHRQPPAVLSVASMDWHPNVDAINWFCDEVLPKIVEQVPKVEFQIVGRGIPASTESRASRHVKVLGFVDDVRELVRDASVMVVPLRIGGGMRLKILNAMAMGKAVVSTPIGCEGIAVTDGVEIAMAETAETFALRVTELLTNSDRGRQMGIAGQNFVRMHYQWSKLVADLEHEYTKLLERRGD